MGAEKAYWLITYLCDCATLYATAFVWFRFPKRSNRLLALLVAGSLLVIFVCCPFAPVPTYEGTLILLLVVLTVFTQLKHPRQFLLLVGCGLAIRMAQALLATLVYWRLGLEFRGDTLCEMLVNILLYMATVLLILLAAAIRGRVYKKQGRYVEASPEHLPTLASCGLAIAGLLAYSLVMVPAQELSLQQGTIEHERQILVGMVVSTVLVFTIVLASLVLNARNQRLKTASRAYARMLKAQAEYYGGIRQRMEGTNAFRHDIQAHMVNLRHYLEGGETGKALQYMDTLLGEMDTTKYAESGHPLVNALIQDIFSTDVPLAWKGRFPLDTSMQDYDICVLLSNLLRNAHTAAKSSKKPFVEVEIKAAASNLKIQVLNSVTHPVSLEKGHPHRDGGYGVQNIQGVVEKYGGEVCFQNTERGFLAEIYLYNVIKKREPA